MILCAICRKECKDITDYKIHLDKQHRGYFEQ